MPPLNFHHQELKIPECSKMLKAIMERFQKQFFFNFSSLSLSSSSSLHTFSFSYLLSQYFLLFLFVFKRHWEGLNCNPIDSPHFFVSSRESENATKCLFSLFLSSSLNIYTHRYELGVKKWRKKEEKNMSVGLNHDSEWLFVFLFSCLFWVELSLLLLEHFFYISSFFLFSGCYFFLFFAVWSASRLLFFCCWWKKRKESVCASFRGTRRRNETSPVNTCSSNKTSVL